MAGHSRLKNGVASLAYAPAIHVFKAAFQQGVDAPRKAGHDAEIDWCYATKPAELSLRRLAIVTVKRNQLAESSEMIGPNNSQRSPLNFII